MLIVQIGTKSRIMIEKIHEKINKNRVFWNKKMSNKDN